MPDLTSMWGRSNSDLITKAFDPSEARANDGQWTSGGGGTQTTVTDPGQRRRNIAQQRANVAAARATDTAHAKALREKLKPPSLDAGVKTRADHAAASVRSSLGIPRGKALARLPAGKRQAAALITSRVRSLVRLRARADRAHAHIGRIQSEMSTPHLGPKASGFLRRQLDAAQTVLAAITQAQQSAAADVATATRVWRGH